MKGYTLLHNKTNALFMGCTDDMTTEDYGMSGLIWYDKKLAVAAAAKWNSHYFEDGPVFVAEVMLPDHS